MAWPEPSAWAQILFVGIGFAMAVAGMAAPVPVRFVLLCLGVVFMAGGLMVYSRQAFQARAARRARWRFDIQKRALIEAGEQILFRASNFYADDAADMERLRAGAVDPALEAKAEAWRLKVLAFAASRPGAARAFREPVPMLLGMPDLEAFRLKMQAGLDRLRAVAFDESAPA